MWATINNNEDQSVYLWEQTPRWTGAGFTNQGKCCGIIHKSILDFDITLENSPMEVELKKKIDEKEHISNSEDNG